MSVEDALSRARERIAPLLEPIAGGVGDDLSYDAAFDAVRIEVDRLQAIDGGKVDWAMVMNTSADLLSNRTKDFRLALYYAAGAVVERGAEGILDGLLLLRELMSQFWEPMYPALRRPKARGNLIGWLSDMATPVVAEIKPSDRATCLAVEQLCQELDREFRTRLEDAYPGMAALKDAARWMVGRAPEDAPPPPPPAPPPPPPSPNQSPGGEVDQAGPPTDRPPAAGGPSPDAMTDRASVNEVMATLPAIFFKAAEVLLNDNPSDADGFRFSRLGAWLLSNRTPDAGADGFTSLPSPRADARETVLAQAQAGSFAELATSADILTTQSIFWLDGVRHLVQALEGLGDDYRNAKLAVTGELMGFVSRHPGLADLKFQDGLPFADDETKAWLSSLGGSGGGGKAGRTPVDKAESDARAMADGNDLPRAVALLNRAVAEQKSPPQRFRARLALARVLADYGANDIAAAQLESLERWVDHNRLVEWEPALATEVFALQYRVLRAMSQNRSDDVELYRRLDRVFDRLSDIDASEALRLSSS